MFERTGVSEPLEVIKFKCHGCGKETLVLMDGKCQLCTTQPKPEVEPTIPKDGDK